MGQSDAMSSLRPKIRKSEVAPPDRAPGGSRLLWSGAALLAAAAALLAGCAFPSPPGRATGDMTALGIEHTPYRIRVGDKLSVRFYKTQELNVEDVPVRATGRYPST